MNKNTTPIFSEQTLFERQTRNGDDCQYRIPAMVVSKTGTVFAFPEERVDSIRDCAKKSLVVRRSFDNGETWRDMDVLHEHPNPRVTNAYASSVADLQTGRVFVFFSRGVAIWPEDVDGKWVEAWAATHPEEAAALRKKLAPDIENGLFVISTDDDGETWTDPKPLGQAMHVMNPVTQERRPFGPQFSGIQLQRGEHAGRLILPGRGWSQTAPFALFANSHNYIAYSDDHGETWQAGGLAQNGTGEACVVELSDGTIYLNSRNESLRCRGYRAWDLSHDGGVNFTESGYDLNLPEPHCAASIVEYSVEPHRVLFCNPAVTTDTNSHYWREGRRNLTVRLSEDDCRTWCASRTVREGTAGYSALAVAHDGTILCAYETLNDKDCTGDIILARFNMEWVTKASS